MLGCLQFNCFGLKLLDQLLNLFKRGRDRFQHTVALGRKLLLATLAEPLEIRNWTALTRLDLAY